jgi:hypothetical protein
MRQVRRLAEWPRVYLLDEREHVLGRYHPPKIVWFADSSGVWWALATYFVESWFRDVGLTGCSVHDERVTDAFSCK